MCRRFDLDDSAQAAHDTSLSTYTASPKGEIVFTKYTCFAIIEYNAGMQNYSIPHQNLLYRYLRRSSPHRNNCTPLIRRDTRCARHHHSVSRCMELALYTPLGYYSGGSIKLGSDGDFTTAPEMTSLFGASLHNLCAPYLAAGNANIMEFGAGRGNWLSIS